MGKEIKGVEIFAEGTWNGHNITADHLANIEAAFHSTKGKVLPHLKLGHDDNQEFLQKDGLPAAGWINNVYREGRKLLADFVDIPDKVAELIKKKAYRKVSSEIYHGLAIDGQTFPDMLGAVSLLGSDLPAVTCLDDMLALYGQDKSQVNKTKSIYDITKDVEKKVFNFSKDQLEGDEMPQTEIEKLQEQLKEANSKVDKFTNDKAEMQKQLEANQKLVKEASEKVEKFSKDMAEKDKKIADYALENSIKDLEQKELCTPAMKPFVQELIGPEKEEYSVEVKKDDKTETKKFNKADLFAECLKLFKAGDVNLNENSTPGKEGDNKKQDTIASHADVEKYAEENKVSYSEAVKALNYGKIEDNQKLTDSED